MSLSRIKLNTLKYCVYHHKIKGKIFYVGCGVSSRPFNIDARNQNWWDKVDENNGKYEVEIIRWFKDQKSALKFEKKEILKQNPATNGWAHIRQQRIDYIKKQNKIK